MTESQPGPAQPPVDQPAGDTHFAINAYDAAQTFVTAQGNIYHSPVIVGPFRVVQPRIEPPGLDGLTVHGRDDLVAEILASRGGCMVLHGLGGCGKSTVARYAAHRWQAEQRGEVYWVSSHLDVQQAMLSVAERRGAEPSQVRDARLNLLQAQRLVWDSLAGGPPWLLVFDDVDDPAVLAGPGRDPAGGTGWLRSSPGGQVLVTSRLGDPRCWVPGALLRKVAPLPPEAGARLLTDLAPGAGSAAEAVELSRRLGGVPLALRLAGQYLGNEPLRHRTFAAYRTALDDELVDLIDLGEIWPAHGGDDLEARKFVRDTWALSLRMLEEKEVPLVRPILRLLSCFGAPHPVRADLLAADRLRGSFVDDGSGGLTQAAVDRALVNLAAVSLLERSTVDSGHGDEPVQCLVMHPLVRDVVAATVLRETDPAVVWHAARECLATATPDDPGDPRDWHRWAALPAVHVALLSALPAGLTDDLAGAIDRALLCTQYLAARGWLPAAHELSQLAVLQAARLPAGDRTQLAARLSATVVNRHEGTLTPLEGELRTLLADAAAHYPDHDPLVIAIRQNLASLFIELHRPEEAAQVFQDIAAACVQAQVAVPVSLRFWYGQLLAQLGEFAAAEEELRAVLAAETAEQGAEHPDTLITRTLLADVLLGLGRFTEGQRELEAVLRLQNEVFGVDSQATLITRTVLFSVLLARGEMDAAGSQLGHVLKIQRDSLNPENPMALLSLATMISFQCAADDDADHEEAVRRIRAVTGVMVRAVGSEDHPLVLATRLQAAASQWHYDPEPAECECAQVAGRLAAAVGERNPATLESRLLYAIMVCERDSVEGEAALRQLRAVHEQVLGGEHPRMIQLLQCLARSTYQNGSIEEAESLLRDALARLVRLHGEDHASIQEERMTLAGVLVELDRHAEAEQELVRLIGSLERTDGPVAETTLSVRVARALARREVKDFPAAERELRAVLEILRREYEPGHGGRLIVEELLGELLGRVGRFPEAEGHLRTALAGLEAGWGETDDDALETRLELGELLHERGDLPGAEEHLQIAFSRLRASKGADDALTRRAGIALAAVGAELQERHTPGPAAADQPALPPVDTPAVPDVPPTVAVTGAVDSAAAGWRLLLTGAVQGADRAELLAWLAPAHQPAPALPVGEQPAQAGGELSPTEPAKEQPVATPLADAGPAGRPGPAAGWAGSAPRAAVPGPWRDGYRAAAVLLDDGFPLAALAGFARVVAAAVLAGSPGAESVLAARLELARLRLDRGDTAAIAHLQELAAEASSLLGAEHELAVRAAAWHLLALPGPPPELAAPARRAADVRYGLVERLSAAGNLPAALRECDSALTELPGLSGRSAPLALRLRAAAGAIRGDRAVLDAVLHAQVERRGRYHPEVAETRHRIGTVLAAAGEPGEAARQFRQALVIRQRRLGRRHPATRSTAAALTVLGRGR
jgi:tetratricopeptide (TPR) repeat protein